ncbi:complex I subunit 5 family protein [Micromonospora sp. NPDC049559]|uniref:complex I subunit 5 family protein n=1 Tax=Micromonospora sp. NPDC049559 TaxID=3155923 RepID=UPI0034270DE7
MRPESLSGLAPLAVVLPIVAAGLVLVAGERVPRPAVDVFAIGTAVVVATLTSALVAATVGGRAVEWAGGWRPREGVSVGVVLVADPFGAGLACLAALLSCCALLYSYRYLEDAEAHYQALMLLFLAGMTGFALSGDLFNMFVFFELMGAAAYALTGLRIEEPDSVQGGFNFAVVNSLGAYLMLTGIGLLYARTGQLGLAPLGAALSGRPADGLVVAAFVLVLTGFLVKAAMVPLHFWLADAHAVAPTPVCVLMSGVMVELGVYAVARVHTTVFAATVPASAVRPAFLTLGVLTAVLGSVMCLGQRHLKRLLAYSTIAHVGLFLIGVAIGDPDSVAGTALYVLGHAGVKGALFLVAGALLSRFQTLDEGQLYGRGGGWRNTGTWYFLLGGLALAGLPPAGPGLGKAVAEEAAEAAGHPWLVAVFVLVSAATGGAVLRAGVRIFLGRGRRPSAAHPEQATGAARESETESRPSRTPVTMLLAIGLLLAGGAAVGVVPALAAGASRGAELFTDRDGYLGQVLSGARPAGTSAAPAVGWSPAGVLLGLLSAALALAIAALFLRPGPARAALARLDGPMLLLRRLHSGHVGDYVAWLFLGAALLAALVGVPLL